MARGSRQIVAFGGGGFSMEWGNTLLDDFVLALTGAPRPRVCFLPTASGDADHYVVRFYRRFSPGCEASHVSLFRRDQGTGGVEDDLAAHLLSQHLIYVGGGNMVSMLGMVLAVAVTVGASLSAAGSGSLQQALRTLGFGRDSEIQAEQRKQAAALAEMERIISRMDNEIGGLTTRVTRAESNETEDMLSRAREGAGRVARLHQQHRVHGAQSEARRRAPHLPKWGVEPSLVA